MSGAPQAIWQKTADKETSSFYGAKQETQTYCGHGAKVSKN